MKQITFAKDLKVGDEMSDCCDEYSTILQIHRNKQLSHGNITVYFANGDKHVYSDCDKVFVLK